MQVGGAVSTTSLGQTMGDTEVTVVTFVVSFVSIMEPFVVLFVSSSSLEAVKE